MLRNVNFYLEIFRMAIEIKKQIQKYFSKSQKEGSWKRNFALVINLIRTQIK